MAGIHHQSRGGSRGGTDQFDWDDVKVDKHRENYLGHSLRAPVGRWQKGKDLTWYTKQSKMAGREEKLKAEIAAVKRAEEEAMAAALGLKPPSQTKPQQALSKQEIAEVCRRRSVEEVDESEERIKGIGFQSRRSQILYSGGDSTTTKDGATVFEHDQSQCANDDRLKMPETKKKQAAPPTTPTTPTVTNRVPDTPTTPTTPTNHVTKNPSLSSNNGEEPHTATKKKKVKKEKKKAKKTKKAKDKRRHDSDSSESEEWTEKPPPAASKSSSSNGHSKSETKRKRHDSLHSEEDKWVEKKTSDHRKKRNDHHHHYDRTEERHSGGKKRSPVEDSRRRHSVKETRRRHHSDSDSEEDSQRRGAKRKERVHQREDKRPQKRQKRQRHDTYTDSD